MAFKLIVWLMLATPQPVPFGPFYSADECERAYSMVAAKYIGSVPLTHECKAI